MSKIPEDIKYTKNHEWIKIENDDIGVVGVTDYAQDQLTDIVFVEFPEIDDQFAKGERVTSIESVKAVSDIYSPVSGVIVEVNSNLEDSPDILNNDPYEEGWIFKIKIEDKTELDDLLDSSAYRILVETGD